MSNKLIYLPDLSVAGDQKYALGEVTQDTDGNIYRYVQLTDDVDTAIGSPVQLYSATSWQVTANFDHGVSTKPVGLSMAVGDASAGDFLWILTKGVGTCVAASNDISAKDFLAMTADAVADTAADTAGGAKLTFGQALTATKVADFTFTALVNC